MKLRNVVYQGEMSCRLNLQLLAKQLINVRYEHRKCPGIIYQNRKIGGNCFIFFNGKINCNGSCESFILGLKRLRRYARVMQKLGYDVRLGNVRLVSASACHKLSGKININSLSPGLNFSYNPELFPAVMLRREGIHFTCHLRGTVLITGIKRLKDLDDVVFPTILEIEMCL